MTPLPTSQGTPFRPATPSPRTVASKRGTSFTPGPWTISDRGDLLRIREEASDAVIATTDNGGHPVEEIFDWDTQRANAALMASAPELFAWLETAIDDFEQSVGIVKSPMHWTHQGRAALAKARGEA